MRRKRMKGLLATTILAIALFGTVAYADKGTFYFSLPAGGSQPSSSVNKSGNSTSAYVEVQSASPSDVYTLFTVVNPSGFTRSASGRIHGVGHTYLSYSGYTVNDGDSLCLKGENEVSYNGGKSIVVSGAWTP